MAAQGKTPGIWGWSELTSSESRDSVGGSDYLPPSPLVHMATAPNLLGPSAMMRVLSKTPYEYHFPCSSSEHRDRAKTPPVLSRATDSRRERNLSGQQFVVQTARGG